MRTLHALVLLCAAATTTQAAPCPDAVTAAALKAVPQTALAGCKPETEDGVAQFEVRLLRADKSVVEVDVSAAGVVLVIEEKIPLAALPAAVTKAFAARFPKATATAAEEQTSPTNGVTYELAFTTNRRHEATFRADGTFLDQE